MIIDLCREWVSHDGTPTFDLEGIENGTRVIRRFEVSRVVLDSLLLHLTRLAMDARANDRHCRSE